MPELGNAAVLERGWGRKSAGVERKALYSAAPETAGAGMVAEVLERWSKRGAVVHSERGGYSSGA